jgi:hypothetical protein
MIHNTSLTTIPHFEDPPTLLAKNVNYTANADQLIKVLDLNTNDYGSDNDKLNQFAARVQFDGTKLYIKNIHGDFFSCCQW